MHRADLRLEAWGPTREACYAEAVRALVDSFLGRVLPLGSWTTSFEVSGFRDDELLVAILHQVIARLRTHNEVPIATEVAATPAGARLRCQVVDAGAILPRGSLPKGLSRHRARCEQQGDGWWCSIRVDV